MKKLLIVFSFAFALITNAQAKTAKGYSKKDDWSAIRVSRDVQVVQPQFAKAFGPSGLFNVCIDGDEFKSIHPVNFCTAHKVLKKSTLNTEEDNPAILGCIQKEAEDVAVSRRVTRPVCLNRTEADEVNESECTEWSEQTFIYPSEYNLDVVYVQSQEAQNVLFKKQLVIPNCN
jgi:hypothetical protein